MERVRAQLDPVNRQILLVGLFEVMELGAPGHVISEHVDLAKTLVYEGAAALTNGDHRRRHRGRSSVLCISWQTPRYAH